MTKSNKPVFAIVDCNNFYVSCERVFNPKLQHKPVIVLSNNDGCVISRSNEAKELGIQMGIPYFLIKKLCAEDNVRVFSSNYQLYGDMSKRVMNIIQDNLLNVEFYSIDEAFAEISILGNNHHLENLCINLRDKLLQYTGIPVSISISYSKTLAKVASLYAKKSHIGVCSLLTKEIIEKALDQIRVKDIWGIGRKLREKLEELNINSAQQLRKINPIILNRFNIVMHRLVEELWGNSCLAIEEVTNRKTIICARPFSYKISRLEELEEAISEYTAKACEKLRSQNSLLKEIHVFVQSIDLKDYGLNYEFDAPTQDTREIISAAKQLINKLYNKNLRYKKVGIILLELISQATPTQLQLLTSTKYYDLKKSKQLMEVIDLLNKQGQNVKFAAQGITCSWKTKSAFKSPNYTTNWHEIPIVI